MRGQELLDKMSLTEDRFVAEADEKPARHRRWPALAACLAVLLVGSALLFRGKIFPLPQPTVANGGYWEGICPQIVFQGTRYYWGDMAHAYEIDGNGQVTFCATEETYLPEGYVFWGEIIGNTREISEAEAVLASDFAATGEIYVNPDQPEVLYLYLTTKIFPVPYYARFVTERLDGKSWIYWQGRLYRVHPEASALPEDAQEIGSLCFIGRDKIPADDLQTNLLHDFFGYYADGRAVFRSPGDADALYIPATAHGDRGYLRCTAD